MNKKRSVIKFSHHYYKLRGLSGCVSEAILLDVIPVKLENLSSYLIEYDTCFKNGFYKLPKHGDYLLLVFDKTTFSEGLFTTLRRKTPQKEKYYRSKIGELFTVEINQ